MSVEARATVHVLDPFHDCGPTPHGASVSCVHSTTAGHPARPRPKQASLCVGPVWPRQVRAAELLVEPQLRRGNTVTLVGLTKHLRIMQASPTKVVV